MQTNIGYQNFVLNQDRMFSSNDHGFASTEKLVSKTSLYCQKVTIRFLAGSSFTRLKRNHSSHAKYDSKIYNSMNVTKLISKTAPIVVTVDLMVQIGTTTELVIFLIIDRLAILVSLQFGLCHLHVQAFQTHLAIVEKYYWATIHIVIQP